jgi:hypothetical protein
MLELIQFEIGISTRRYFPAIGTAGLLRVAVSGYNLDPAPPPSTMAITDLLSIRIELKNDWFDLMARETNIIIKVTSN